MTAQEIDRIQCAIRHIQTSVDVDDWAVEIAVDAMKKQIPKIPTERKDRYTGDQHMYCTKCKAYLAYRDRETGVVNRYIRGLRCPDCGQALDFGGNEG